MGRKSVLITGATGSIGHKLRRHLEAAGHYDLRLLDAKPRDDPAVAAVDLSQPDEGWARLFQGVAAIVHLAADGRPWASAEAVKRNNIEATRNVFLASIRAGVKRVVFASSTWTMEGYRFSKTKLTSDLPPRPTTPYGRSKLAGEQMGKRFNLSPGLSVICLRIGWCQASPGNVPGPHMGGRWAQEKWISDRDLCHLIERAILAEGIGFAVVNAVSDNAGMRWDLEGARRLLGYAPVDGHAAIVTPAARLQDGVAFVRHLRWRLLAGAQRRADLASEPRLPDGA
jgi:NAD+ dependent glucose-6-phosphate dehydrogenase